MPELEDVGTDQQPGGLAVHVAVDRTSAARLGLSASMVDNTLYDAFGQRQIDNLYTQSNQYRVILEAIPQLRTRPLRLEDLFLQGATPSASPSPSVAANAASGANPSYQTLSSAPTSPVLFTPTPSTAFALLPTVLSRALATPALPELAAVGCGATGIDREARRRRTRW